MDTSTQAAMVLHRLPQIGASTYWRLLDAFGTPEIVLDLSPTDLKPYLNEQALTQLLQYQQQRESSVIGQTVSRDIEWIQEAGATVIDSQSEHYPAFLKEIYKPPPLLYLRGDPSCLNLPQIAMVGSRSPSHSGRENGFEFAQSLAKAGFTITSGLALGVDGAAHLGALTANGKTLAVLGTGVDIFYPRRHRDLVWKIIDNGGAIISEFPLGCEARPNHFPQRNRIISGLSLGVLVVEASLKSGSLITAGYAMQQNREVFAIPGSIHNPTSRGCHALIRNGATLVECVEDMIQHLEALLALKRQEITPSKSPQACHAKVVHRNLNEQQQKLLSCLSFEVVSVEMLLARSGMEVSEIMSNLVVLELMGLVGQMGVGYQRCK